YFVRLRIAKLTQRHRQLSSAPVQISLEWAKTMTWKGLYPVVKLVETTYEKGKRMAKKAFKTFADRVTRDISLPKYFMTIQPQI
ncbi:MAG: hypothetical protein MZW92_09135, partial [Comamonadaceae bacterium]|nr:hypothetical protein [Comamonadaceae bacterium]